MFSNEHVPLISLLLGNKQEHFGENDSAAKKEKYKLYKYQKEIYKETFNTF